MGTAVERARASYRVKGGGASVAVSAQAPQHSQVHDSQHAAGAAQGHALHGTLSVETHSILSQSTRALSLWARAPHPVRCAAFFVRSEKSNALVGDGFPQPARRARRTSTAPSVACISLRLKPGEQLLCCSHALHSWHSLLCGCHSCHSDGLALTGPQSLVLRLV